MDDYNSSAGITAFQPPLLRRLSVATWNMDHWKRTAQARRDGWSYLATDAGCDVALLQECVPPPELDRSRIVYREIGGSRPWGSAVALFSDDLQIEEIGAVRTRYGSTRFPMLGTYPGATIVTRVTIPSIGPITFVSVYGLINVYAQTTMLRIVADLIPLFDSKYGDRVVLGGDFNIGTTVPPTSRDLPRYEAVIKAVESLGLRNLAETAAERPPQLEYCLCGAASCHHLRTYGDSPGGQLDWLFATPELAARCSALRVDGDRTYGLSDHAPIVADFDITTDIPEREWEPESFVYEMGLLHGSEVGGVVEEVIAWAQRKHHELRRRHSFATLDRLPISKGPQPELWVQLDLKFPEGLGWTVSLSVDGKIRVQFQYMQQPPFDALKRRKRMLDDLNELPGVSIAEKLTGRPSFQIAALARGENLARFLAILEDTVNEMVDLHKARSSPPSHRSHDDQTGAHGS